MSPRDQLSTQDPVFAKFAQQIPGVLYLFHRTAPGQYRIPFASPRLRDLFEVEPEAVIDDASPVLARIHPDDAARVQGDVEHSAMTMQPFHCRYRVILPVAGERWHQCAANPEQQADGTVLWYGHCGDITGEETTRQALRDSERRYRILSERAPEDTMRRLEAAIESSLSAIAVADLAGNLTYVNTAFLRLWGHRTADEVIGRPAVSFWARPADAEAVVSALMQQGRWNGELLARRVDGQERTLSLQASLFRSVAGAPLGMLASFADITEERQLQQHLQQAQRLESVGRLAGGVAHDFNNLLTVMKGNLELMELEPADRTHVTEGLHEIEHAVDSASRLTQQLLAFSRKQIIAPRALDLNAVVLRTITMLRRLLGEHIELRFTPGADLRQVMFDPGQAEQVLVNLAVNARDAMPDGGTLHIETANVSVASTLGLRGSVEPPTSFVRLTVTDTGSGMSAETLDHAFEPFYTTKRPGEGTGLGLSMIHGAVMQNGGKITLTSELGRGAKFVIDLPAVATVPDDGATRNRERPAGGHEHVLLVEDDEHLRRMAERLLRQLGYTVTAADSGERALQYLERDDSHCDLLLTDVIMPQMNGKMLADRVVNLRPSVKVLFMSGYTADVIAHHGVLAPEEQFLAKPFTLRELADQVRDTLDRPVS